MIRANFSTNRPCNHCEIYCACRSSLSMSKLLPVRHWCVARLRYLSSSDKSCVLSRCRLQIGSLPPRTFRAMRHRRSSRTRPQVSVIIQATLVCRPAPRTNAKCSSNGTEAPDQNCKSVVLLHLQLAFVRTLFVSHHIWLRDHCRCPECFHSVTKQRLINTFDVISFPLIHHHLFINMCLDPP